MSPKKYPSNMSLTKSSKLWMKACTDDHLPNTSVIQQNRSNRNCNTVKKRPPRKIFLGDMSTQPVSANTSDKNDFCSPPPKKHDTPETAAESSEIPEFTNTGEPTDEMMRRTTSILN